MIIYRVPPFPLFVDKGGLSPSTEYSWAINDEYSMPIAADESMTDDGGILHVPVPFPKYDAEYLLEIYDQSGNIIADEMLYVVRPYMALEELSSDPVAAAKLEAIARAVVDSVTGGFYYKLQVEETEGTGGDYLSIPARVNKVLRVWEAGELVYDSLMLDNRKSYAISKDKSSIVLTGDSDYESGTKIRPLPAYSDSYGGYGGSSGAFPKGVDYIVEFESGYPIIPSKVKQAMVILANDASCGSDYLNHYILEYNTDQYKIKYSARVFGGTGNKQVDLLLSGFADYNVRAALI